MHDPTVDRTTDGTGLLSSLTLAQVSILDAGSWYAPEFAGTPVPTLVDGISDGEIDDWYETGRRSGALGGKLSGAGRGDFTMFFAPPERHAAIVHAQPGLREVRFRCDTNGSQIIFYRP